MNSTAIERFCDDLLDFESIQALDIELTKKGKKENPTQVMKQEKAVKWYHCPKYVSCLNIGDENDWINWSCVNCKLIKQAQVKELAVFRACVYLNKLELEAVKKFEKQNRIKTSKTDNNV